MGLTLDRVVPWGRSFDEYVRMFDLSEADLQSGILCCADGPAAFNAEMRSRGCRVVSADPIYVFSADAIRQRIEDTYAPLMAGVNQHRDTYVWDTIRSPEELGRRRMGAMSAFLADFPDGAREGRRSARQGADTVAAGAVARVVTAGGCGKRVGPAVGDPSRVFASVTPAENPNNHYGKATDEQARSAKEVRNHVPCAALSPLWANRPELIPCVGSRRTLYELRHEA